MFFLTLRGETSQRLKWFKKIVLKIWQPYVVLIMDRRSKDAVKIFSSVKCGKEISRIKGGEVYVIRTLLYSPIICDPNRGFCFIRNKYIKANYNANIC